MLYSLLQRDDDAEEEQEEKGMMLMMIMVTIMRKRTRRKITVIMMTIAIVTRKVLLKGHYNAQIYIPNNLYLQRRELSPARKLIWRRDSTKSQVDPNIVQPHDAKGEPSY